ncbi:MAG: carboxypeptidase regulatory-like domain-containing protein [Aridibacter famidurans]|nr:carboxypeptidase regulatory-like domain-containing protein [Aridibacter famidurans]
MRRRRAGLTIGILGTLLGLALLVAPVTSTRAEIVRDLVDSKMIAGNLLGESPKREVLVYLPPQYESSRQRYPVVYLLHSYGSGPDSWLGKDGYEGMDLEAELDRQIRPGSIRPMIVVMPDARTKLGGSWYADSAASGKWESFISEELVEFIDSKYRTIASRDFRGIAGQSMGGYGALRIAMHHPDVFGAVLGMSAVNLVNPNPFGEAAWKAAFESGDPSDPDANLLARLMWSKAAAFSPNPDSERFADLPFEEKDGGFVKRKDVWDTWLGETLVRQVPAFVDELKQLRIRLEAGSEDAARNEMSAFAGALSEKGIPFTSVVFEGGHVGGVRKRFEGPVLEFFERVFLVSGYFVSGVQGRITDYAGAVVPGARVRFKNKRSGEMTTVVANLSGEYSLWLPQGEYEVEVHESGFGKVVRKRIRVSERGISIVDIVLDLSPSCC